LNSPALHFTLHVGSYRRNNSGLHFSIHNTGTYTISSSG
jgi:hypothetical protein